MASRASEMPVTRRSRPSTWPRGRFRRSIRVPHRVTSMRGVRAAFLSSASNTSFTVADRIAEAGVRPARSLRPPGGNPPASRSNSRSATPRNSSSCGCSGSSPTTAGKSSARWDQRMSYKTGGADRQPAGRVLARRSGLRPRRSVLDRRPSGKVGTNPAAHHLRVVGDVEVPARPERAVRDAARDGGEADVLALR